MSDNSSIISFNQNPLKRSFVSSEDQFNHFENNAQSQVNIPEDCKYEGISSKE